MGVNEKILELVKQKGPVLPAQVSKEINDSLLLTSARLSELLSAKELRISTVKVGGSPLYYVTGQESQLQNFSNYLKEKEREAYDLLKQYQVLADDQQEPAIRVALRSIKDFAVPLEVLYNNEKKIFWKWYLLPSDKVQQLIKDLLSGKQVVESHEIKQEKKQVEESPTPQKIEEKKVEEEKIPEQKKEEPKSETTHKENPELKPQKNQEPKKEIAQTTLSDKKEKTVEKPTSPSTTDYNKKIQSFFSRKNITILLEEEIKKNNEMNYTVEIDSSIGKITYFCKFKKKQRINDGDLSSAVVQAQSKGLPLLFISNGILTKRTEESLKDNFKNLIFKTI